MPKSEIDMVIEQIGEQPDLTYVLRRDGRDVAVILSPEHLEDIRLGLAPPIESTETGEG